MTMFSLQRMDDFRKEIGRRIMERRTELGLTQQKLGMMVGVNNIHISRVELGQQNVSIDTLAKILEGIEMSFEDLFKGL